MSETKHEFVNHGAKICTCGLDYDGSKDIVPSSREQFVAHLAALASQVPAQSPALEEKMSVDAEDELMRQFHEAHPEIEALERAAPVPAQGTPPAQPEPASHIKELPNSSDWWNGRLYEHRAFCAECRRHIEHPEIYGRRSDCPNYVAMFREAIRSESAPAPASPQIADTLENELTELCWAYPADASNRKVFTSQQVAIIMERFRTKLRAALDESDKRETVLHEEIANKLDSARTESYADGYKHGSVGAREEALGWVEALAVRWDKIANTLDAGIHPTDHCSRACDFRSRAAELRALAAQPTPAPKGRQ